jgi:peptidoglycan hydrolase CwlO-like protein
MTIDERLQALTQSMELIAHAQADSEHKIRQLTALQAETAGFINQLARVAESHEHRIAELAAESEQRIQQLAEESKEADRRLGERIASLVSGFGEFIAKVDERLARIEDRRQ